MSRLLLYHAAGSCSLAALAALEASGAPFETQAIRTSVGEQRSPEYLRLNPLGQVPALVVDGVVVCETLAVLTYLAARFPQARLLPSDEPMALAKAYEFLSWFATNLHAAVAQTWRAERFSDEAEIRLGLGRAGRGRYERALARYEDWCQRSDGDWLLGDAFTAVDPLSVVAFRWADRMEIEVAAYPAFSAHADRASAHPAVARALAREARSA
jgi:glutathione S-transferase